MFRVRQPRKGGLSSVEVGPYVVANAKRVALTCRERRFDKAPESLRKPAGIEQVFEVVSDPNPKT